MKKLIIIIVSVLVVLLVVGFAKDLIIKTSVEKGVEVVTGLRLSIKSFRVGIINTLVGIKSLKLFNPKGYPDKVMLDMPEIYVDYDLPAIVKGKVHLTEVRINLKEFMVVKNEKGELNLDSLNVVQEQQPRKKRAKEPEPKEEGKEPDLQIDVLELKIGKVIYKDYSKGGAPSVREFDLKINEKYENIDDPNKLVALIVVRALMNTTIGRLADFDVKGLQGSVSDTLASAQKVTAEAAAKAQETAKQAAKTAKETTEAVKKTTEEVQKAFKMPFGGK